MVDLLENYLLTKILLNNWQDLININLTFLNYH